MLYTSENILTILHSNNLFIFTYVVDLSGAHPGFLEKGFRFIMEGEGVRFADFISFFLNIP